MKNNSLFLYAEAPKNIIDMDRPNIKMVSDTKMPVNIFFNVTPLSKLS